MSIKNRVKAVTGPAAILWFLCGAGASLLAAGNAFSSVPTSGPTAVTCEYTLQLLNSARLRGQYVAQVIEYGGIDLTGASPVEAMYANVQKVSYDSSATPSPGGVDLWGLGLDRGTRQGSVLDPMSMECLGCHDGSTASAIHVDLRNDPFGKSRVSSFRGDHPMGMNYASYVGARKGYKQVLAGTSNMVFVNGKVGCLTCHNPLNAEPGHLVMSDRNSALCLTCHNK
ncbi:MAG TPA: cytochrome c3 family protein [Geomonas sp.]|nr:cytochrome c3 family protein [Geomonas sp.]